MASLPQTLALQIRRTLHQPDADNVHDLRVAIRRFSQALDLSSQNNDPLRRSLKKTMKLAGEVRNIDITLNLIEKLKGTKDLQTRLHRRRGEAEARLRKALGRWDTSKIPAKLPHAAPAPQHALVRAARRLFKRASKAGDPKGLHRTRIAAKKLRYTLELIAPDHPRMNEIKRIQSQLGQINDYATAWTLLKAESAGKSVGNQLKQKQAKRIEEFHGFWADLFLNPARQREWIREFSAIRARNVSRTRRS